MLIIAESKNEYLERKDYTVTLPISTPNEIEIVFYPIGRDVTAFVLNTYPKFPTNNEVGFVFTKVEGQMKYAVGRSLLQDIILSIKTSLKEYLYKDENFELSEAYNKVLSDIVAVCIKKIDSLYESKVKNFYCETTGRMLGNARIVIKGKCINNSDNHIVCISGEHRYSFVRMAEEKLIELGIFPKVINYDKYVYLLIDKILDSRIVLKDLNSFCNYPVIVDKQFNFIIDTSLKVDNGYISALCHQ